ncbi:hypothetical protein HQ487_01530 [Candidatus Uhrbacteria bacterium]|nr:hypothetical protein [Candidatus Uhrbacteria bacterium]
MPNQLIISLFILLGALFFLLNALMILRIKSFQQLMSDYKAGKLNAYKRLFFLNIQFYPIMFQNMINTMGDKTITSLLHLFGYFLLFASISSIASAVILLFV